MSTFSFRQDCRSFLWLLLVAAAAASTPAQSKDLPPKEPIGASAKEEPTESSDADGDEASGQDSDEASADDEGSHDAKAKPADNKDDDEGAPGKASAEKAAAPAAAEKKASPVAEPVEPVTPADAKSAAAPAAPASAAPAAPKATPAAAPANQSAPAQAGEPKSAGNGHVAPTLPSASDVYNERANEVLEAESSVKQTAKVHPLALRYPDHDVIVCTAGCGQGGRVVYKERKDRRRGIAQAQMIPTSAQASPEAAPAAASNALTCIAGCFTTPKSYRAVEKRADLVNVPMVSQAAPALPAAAAPEAQASQPGVGATADMFSGKWTSSDAEDGGKTGGTGEPDSQKTKSRAMGSGDWMKKINADKTAPAARPE